MIQKIENLPDKVNLEADVCVIGSGAGGAVAAAVLAEAGRSVVVLEEGGYFSKKNFQDRDIMWAFREMYRNAGSTGTVGMPPILLPIGKTVGGSTTVNSGTMFRTPDRVLKEWEWTYGVQDAGPEHMSRYLDIVEETTETMPVREEILGENQKMIREGAEILGLSHGPLRRNANRLCSGCGVCCFGCPSDGKRPMHLNFIPRAVKAGAEIYPRCRAEKLIVNNRRVSGVRGTFTQPNHKGVRPEMEVRAKVTLLCGGAVFSPVFLLKQKLANSSKQVGKNLTIHPASRVGAMFDEPIYGWKGVPQGYYIDEYCNEGIMAEGAHGPPSLMGGAVPGVGKIFKEHINNIAYFADFGVMVSDTGTGSIKVGSRGDPIMLYQMNKEDTRRMKKGLGMVASVFLAAGAKRTLPAVWKYPEISTTADVLKFRETTIKPKDIQVGAFHPLGTCRMGEDPKKTVVNSYLKCHDLDNLYVVDGSPFPTSLGVNPQETIMAFAYRTAEYIANTVFHP